MIKNIEASIRAKLLKIAKDNKLPFDYIVLRYIQEKIIKRLSLSDYRDNFILKGGLFFLLFDNLNPRVTKDIDFLGKSIENSEEFTRKVFEEIISIELDDGILFEELETERIKEDADYEGIRLNIDCKLGKIKKRIQIDIGYGDKVYPKIKYADYPSLLGEKINDILIYSLETVIAEKFEAMVKLSILNSRMKDFYDIFNIIYNYEIDMLKIQNAIKITFENRKTDLAENPTAFTEEFYKNEDKIRQWNGFMKRLKIEKLEFEKVIFLLKAFLDPILKNILENKEENRTWKNDKQKWEDV